MEGESSRVVGGGPLAIGCHKGRLLSALTRYVGCVGPLQFTHGVDAVKWPALRWPALPSSALPCTRQDHT